MQAAQWESFHWRRQILSLMYFHHLFYEFPSLLVEFSFCPSAGTCRAHYLRLPKASVHFSKSVLFKLAVQWNKIPEETHSVENSKKFAYHMSRDGIHGCSQSESVLRGQDWVFLPSQSIHFRNKCRWAAVAFDFRRITFAPTQSKLAREFQIHEKGCEKSSRWGFVPTGDAHPHA